MDTERAVKILEILFEMEREEEKKKKEQQEKKSEKVPDKKDE